MNSLELEELSKFGLEETQFKFIPAAEGDVIFWDWRLPHKNERHNVSNQFREAVYLGMLPNVALNRKLVKEQLNWIKKGEHPSFMMKKYNYLEATLDYKPFQWSELGKKLVGQEPWKK
jgi:hypothetical protein